MNATIPYEMVPEKIYAAAWRFARWRAPAVIYWSDTASIASYQDIGFRLALTDSARVSTR
jgi:hypothetical protein